MKASIQHKLEALVERHEEISALLAEPETMADQNKFRTLSQEYAQLEPVVNQFTAYQACLVNIEEAKAMLAEDDEELKLMAQEELQAAQTEEAVLDLNLQKLLLPTDPNDERNIFIEVRAGTGGDEAAIFAGDLYRMYSRYAERQGWRTELINAQEGEHGGYKEVVGKNHWSGCLLTVKI